MNLLLTGASGFVGAATRAALLRQGHTLRLAVRRTPVVAAPGETCVPVGDLDDWTEWADALTGVQAVVHLAARVHVMNETAADALSEFRRINTAGTERLARAAASAGARRLVYVSSVKVNGESTDARPFTRDDRPAPRDPYGVSKWEAEQALARVGRETGLEVVVVRPPLVYGPGVRGNFLRLLNLARLGLPLPFGAATNRRSLVYVKNLAGLLATAATHPAAAGKVYLAGDGDDLSTAELCARLARDLGKTPRLLPVPVALLRVAASLAGRTAEYQRLFGSLQVDITPATAEIGWTPPFTVGEGLRDTCEWFARERR